MQQIEIKNNLSIQPETNIVLFFPEKRDNFNNKKWKYCLNRKSKKNKNVQNFTF